MLNTYAAKHAASVLRKHIEGDSVGHESVIGQLDAIASGKWMVVPVEASEIKTEEVRRHMATVYSLLDRPDPTCEEYRGAIMAAKAYIDDTCPWIRDYYWR